MTEIAPQFQKVGRYVLKKLLGEGGMSAVYLAERDDGFVVALKVLPRTLARDFESLERWKREAAVAMGLDHPNIVNCYDVDVSDGYHYMAMEYVPGGDAEHLLHRLGGRIPERTVIEIARDITKALECANTFGLVHRDIKPENILFSDDGMARLTDFGLVKHELTDGKITQFGKAMGTPHFMSPEQASGQRQLDVRSDFFSLGSTCFYLLTGKTPYDGESAYEIVTKIVNEDPPLLKDTLPEASDACASLIGHLMAFNPDDRPQNPADLGELFRIYLAGENLPPLPPFGILQTPDRPSSEEKAFESKLEKIIHQKPAGAEVNLEPPVENLEEVQPVRPPSPHPKHLAGTSSHRQRKHKKAAGSVRHRTHGTRHRRKSRSSTGFIVVFVVLGIALIAAGIFLILNVGVSINTGKPSGAPSHPKSSPVDSPRNNSPSVPEP